ncbi:hypothetical protein ACJX0J_004238 (mitochondrion) [Zea mays]
MSRAPTVYPLFYYFPPLILESAHNCGVFIVGLKLLPKVSLKIEIFFGLDAQIDGIAANSIFIPFISIPLNLIPGISHLEGGNFQCALGLIARLRQRIDGASLQNRFRPNEFKAVLKSMRCSENNNMLSLKIQKPIYIISSLHLDRCVVWQSEDDLKTFLKSLRYLSEWDSLSKENAIGDEDRNRKGEERYSMFQAERLIQAPYKAGKLYAVSATKRREAKLFNVGEKQKKQLLYSKFIILLYLHFLSIYFKEASNMTFSNEVFASPL